MSEVATRIPIDRTTGKYKREWHATQAEQVSLRPICLEAPKVQNVDRDRSPGSLLLLLLDRTPTMTACGEE